MAAGRPPLPPPPRAAATSSALAKLLGPPGAGREPVLPVRTQRARAGGGWLSSLAASDGGRSSHPGRGDSWGKPAKPGRRAALRRAAVVIALALLLAASVPALAAWLYVRSMLHESPAAVAEAAAEAQAAAQAAAAAGQPLVDGYTVVGMSYIKRLDTVRLVVNLLGRCPHGEPRQGSGQLSGRGAPVAACTGAANSTCQAR